MKTIKLFGYIITIKRDNILDQIDQLAIINFGTRTKINRIKALRLRYDWMSLKDAKEWVERPQRIMLSLFAPIVIK